MNNCTICFIASGKEKSYTVYEDTKYIAFLDTHPLFFGHCLLAPKKHIATLYDLAKTEVGPYFLLAQQLGMAIESSMAAEGSFIAINNNVSQSIPHLHTHIVPRNRADGLRGFFWPRTKYASDKELVETQNKIKTCLSELQRLA